MATSDDSDRADSTTIDPDVAGDSSDRVDSSAGRFHVASRVVAGRGNDRYERGDEIARGGLGRVTSALDRTLQREVAIKELHERTEQGRRRFVREGLTTARLQHPAIVPILDAGTWEGGAPYLVMKLLAGKTLAEELQARTTADARLALLPNLLAVADALGYAHEQGVVHRDVKPANIMIGTHGETVLLDWGIAFDSSASVLETQGKGRGPEPVALDGAVDEQLTVAGTLAGTVRYMSPEQARGEPPVPGFDVYSLGVTIATVLGGRASDAGESQEQLVERLRTGKAIVPVLADDIPADLGAIVAKATAAPVERYAHAGQVADDLRKFIAGQLVSARRYSRGQLVARWLRRNRVYVGAAGAALVVVAAIAVIAVRSVVHQRNLAVTERQVANDRARDLVLLQARASLRADPTATIAWLKQYPVDAPHQDEVLALVDEAEGRGVARHVWRTASSPADAMFTPDNRALAIANHDGTLVRGELATGALRTVGSAGKPLLFVRAIPGALYTLDQDGGIHRSVGDGPFERRQTITISSRANGLYFVPATNELKVVFPDDEATLIPTATNAPARITELPKQLDDYEFCDDENNGQTWYILQPSGELFVGDPWRGDLHAQWKFAPGTWIRSSYGGDAYMAIVPGPKGRGMGDGVTIWLGKSTGAPVQVGPMRACAPGDDRDELAEVSDDGRVAVVKRCGTMAVFSMDREPRQIVDAERIAVFGISSDGRWVTLGRSGGLEVIDLVTGARRELAGASTIALAELSLDRRWIYSSGGEQGMRVWPLVQDMATTVGKLGGLAAPTRLVVTDRAGELAIQRHLACSQWSLGDRKLARTFGATAAQARDLDDEELLWPQGLSADGDTCAFAGLDGALVVARADGTTRTLTPADRRDLESCVLSSDGARATCRTDEPAIVTLDVSTGQRSAARAVTGKLRGLVGYRRAPVALVASATGCTLESAAGDILATLPGGPDCRRLRASGSSQLGRESALLVERPSAIDVWSAESGVVRVPTETGLVEVSAGSGLAAVARDQTIQIWDLRTRSLREGPSSHAHAIERLAWSANGVLASADDETVHLWDPQRGVTRVIYAPHATSIVWSRDGRTLYTTDGESVVAWPVDLARGASPAEVRARLDALTTARIVDGRVATP